MRKQVQYRVLIVRLGAMGDILHALPAVTALRKAHPFWIIDWAIDPKWRPLLCSEPAESDALSSDPSRSDGQSRNPSRPVVDTIYEVPSKAWGKRLLSSQTRAEIKTLRSRLKAGRYDAVLDLQGAIRSAAVARLSGCRRIVGEAHPRETPARWLFTERVETQGIHVIEQDFELASAVAGDLLSPTEPWLPVDKEAEDWCARHEEVRRAKRSGKPIVLIHPGGGWGAKRWPAERYAIIAKEFARRGAVVLVNAGPGEEPLAATAAGIVPERLPAKPTEPTVSSRYEVHEFYQEDHGEPGGRERLEADEPHDVLAEFAAVFARETPAASTPQNQTISDGPYATVVQSTLPQLIALTRCSTLVIGGDTGPLHLASALGKSVVGIYGPTDPKRNGPFGNRSRVLRNPESRRDHTRREEPEAGLLTITPQAVIDAALERMMQELSDEQSAAEAPPTAPRLGDWQQTLSLDAKNDPEFDPTSDSSSYMEVEYLDDDHREHHFHEDGRS